MATPGDIDISLSGPELPEITSSGAEMDVTSLNKPEANTKEESMAADEESKKNKKRKRKGKRQGLGGHSPENKNKLKVTIGRF